MYLLASVTRYVTKQFEGEQSEHKTEPLRRDRILDGEQQLSGLDRAAYAAISAEDVRHP